MDPFIPKNVPRRAALSAVLTVVFLGCVELGLGAFGLGASRLYAGDPGHYWTLHPNLDLPEVDHLETRSTFSVRTNADGLRDDPVPEQGPWVLALGCSTTFGWGVSAEEAWPERLQALIGVPVVNAGVPGHSSHQGARFARALLARHPTVAVLGWGVRDAQLAGAPDLAALPTPWPRTTRLFRFLRDLLPRSERQGQVQRVSPAHFQRNLEAVVQAAQAEGVNPLLLDFPSVQPSAEHGDALDALGVPVLRPMLAPTAFFESDPIHLRASGHLALAEALQGPVEALLPGP